MVKTLNTPYNSFDGRRNKDKHFEVQMKRVFAAFKLKLSTILMVSSKREVLRANICCCFSEWQEQGRILLLKQGVLQIAKYFTRYYTTDINFFSQS